ncbi:MAG: hypothetical protein ACR2PM_04320 [Hyphomicrobiales bacterium]
MEQLEQYWQFGAALIFVLALIGILFWVLQKVGFGGGKGRRGNRLGIVEAAVVDKRRRLVLVRRDQVEHLVMIGGPQDVVVETNISRREPSLAAGTGEPVRGGVIPELALRAAERDASQHKTVASPPPEKAPERKPVEAAEPPAQPPEKPLPHPDEPVRRAEPPVPVPQEPVIHVEAPAPLPDEPVRRIEPAAAGPDGPVRGPEPLGPGPEGPVRAMEAQVVGPNRPPKHTEDPRHYPEMAPRRPQEPLRPAPQGRPWPPSEGRFREAQRRFAERSDLSPQGRGDRHQPAEEPGPVRPPERHIAQSAQPNGMSAPEEPGDVSQQDGPPPEPANLNVRPGEDR